MVIPSVRGKSQRALLRLAIKSESRLWTYWAGSANALPKLERLKSWAEDLMRMAGKMRVDADAMDTETLRMIYVFSRVEGDVCAP